MRRGDWLLTLGGILTAGFFVWVGIGGCRIEGIRRLTTEAKRLRS